MTKIDELLSNSEQLITNLDSAFTELQNIKEIASNIVNGGNSGGSGTSATLPTAIRKGKQHISITDIPIVGIYDIPAANITNMGYVVSPGMTMYAFNMSFSTTSPSVGRIDMEYMFDVNSYDLPFMNVSADVYRNSAIGEYSAIYYGTIYGYGYENAQDGGSEEVLRTNANLYDSGGNIEVYTATIPATPVVGDIVDTRLAVSGNLFYSVPDNTWHDHGELMLISSSVTVINII
jgi:hypothetical protein